MIPWHHRMLQSLCIAWMAIWDLGIVEQHQNFHLNKPIEALRPMKGCNERNKARLVSDIFFYIFLSEGVVWRKWCKRHNKFLHFIFLWLPIWTQEPYFSTMRENKHCLQFQIMISNSSMSAMLACLISSSCFIQMSIGINDFYNKCNSYCRNVKSSLPSTSQSWSNLLKKGRADRVKFNLRIQWSTIVDLSSIMLLGKLLPLEHLIPMTATISLL